MLRRKPSNAGEKEPGHKKVSAGDARLPSAPAGAPARLAPAEPWGCRVGSTGVGGLGRPWGRAPWGLGAALPAVSPCHRRPPRPRRCVALALPRALAPTLACSPEGWAARTHRPPAPARAQAGCRWDPWGSAGGQQLPLPVGSPQRGRPPAVSCRGWGRPWCRARSSQPGPRSKGVCGRGSARLQLRHVRCRFLRQHRTERWEPPAAPVGSTGCQHRGPSRAPGTAGPCPIPPALAPAGTSALARPWQDGFGDTEPPREAWGQRLVPWSCPGRADIPAELRAMAAPGKLPREIWVKPPLPGAGGGPASPAGPGGHPLPLPSCSHRSHFPLAAKLPGGGGCPRSMAPLPGFPEPLSQPPPAPPPPGQPPMPQLSQLWGAHEVTPSEGCRGRPEGFESPGSGWFRGAGAGVGRTASPLRTDAPAELVLLRKAAAGMWPGLPHPSQPSTRKWQKQVIKDAQSSR